LLAAATNDLARSVDSGASKPEVSPYCPRNNKGREEAAKSFYCGPLRRKQATPPMSDSSDVPQLNRGELMRQIAALHARLATSFQRGSERPRLTVEERHEVIQQIAALESRLIESSFKSAAFTRSPS
jgi:hypothetical protein